MHLIRHFLELWRWRLARLLERSQDTDDGSRWLWGVRARILHFLISRYSGPAAPVSVGSTGEAAPPGDRETVCLVEPHDSPPKPVGTISALLAAIQSANTEARRRLRWRWF